MRTTTLVIGIAVVLSTACGRSPPPQAPAPEASWSDLALMRPVQDSLGITNSTRVDTVPRASHVSLPGLARAGSADALTNHAAARSTELRQELSVMIHFDVAQSQIRPDGGAALDRKVVILNANPDVRLQITGATDDRGSDAYNQALGTRRAEAVKRYLVDKGINAGRLSELSSGKMVPLDADHGELARARNRRVEFVIVSADRPLAMKE